MENGIIMELPAQRPGTAVTQGSRGRGRGPGPGLGPSCPHCPLPSLTEEPCPSKRSWAPEAGEGHCRAVPWDPESSAAS